MILIFTSNFQIFGKANWAIEKGAEVGKANGLSLLLDAETFDYTFHLKAGEGFKGRPELLATNPPFNSS